MTGVDPIIEDDRPPGGALSEPRLYATDETGATVALETIRKGRYNERFLTMFNGVAQHMSTLKRPAAYWRVMLYCLATLDPIHFRRLAAADVAKATGVSRAATERAMALLEADRVVIAEGATAAKVRRLNRSVCSMSRADRWARAQAEEMDPLPAAG
ncbi:MAG: hypothetical protein AAGD12_05035, partial [Pseudomonadota bacterium]